MIVSCHRWLLPGLVLVMCAMFSVPTRASEERQLPVENEVAVVETENESFVSVTMGVDSEPAIENSSEQSTGAKPTHAQSSLIKINADGLDEANVLCFCLAENETLLAGCHGATSEIRIFDSEGKFSSAIDLPVKPEAINVASDGKILVAGQGKLLRLNAEGEILDQTDAPHAEKLRDSREELREEVIEQHKQQMEMMPRMLEAYAEAIGQLETQIEQLGEENEAERMQLEATITAYKEAREQLGEQVGEDSEPEELSEEKIEELIDSSLEYKMAVASISSTDDAVFIASRSPVGYGYDIWRTTAEFDEAEKIVTGLSGCCGQMDVQAGDDGVFVAENSRKRVRRFDAEGSLICEWGDSSEGVHGFGSCCNPMNLAFGSDGSVYTAEDTSGRIKRYSVDGDLLSVVGAADLVPGCSKVSIGVDATGDRVYMLDITRNHVVVMSRVLPDPVGPIVEAEESRGWTSRLLNILGAGN